MFFLCLLSLPPLRFSFRGPALCICLFCFPPGIRFLGLTARILLSPRSDMAPSELLYTNGYTTIPGDMVGLTVVKLAGEDGYLGELTHMIESICRRRPPTVVTARKGLSAVEILP